MIQIVPSSTLKLALTPSIQETVQKKVVLEIESFPLSIGYFGVTDDADNTAAVQLAVAKAFFAACRSVTSNALSR